MRVLVFKHEVDDDAHVNTSWLRVLITSVIEMDLNGSKVMSLALTCYELHTDIPEFNFTFNERTIPITNSHKHLGVTFSSDLEDQ
jgi:hypothetical protein